MQIRTMTLAKLLGAVAGIVFILFTLWFLSRAATFGILNVFSREYVFVETRPLSEDVAIEVTRKALQASGYDVSVLTPYSIGGESKRVFFARNTIDPNGGRVSWGSGPAGVWLSVNILKDGDKIRCRVYRPK